MNTGGRIQHKQPCRTSNPVKQTRYFPRPANKQPRSLTNYPASKQHSAESAAARSALPLPKEKEEPRTSRTEPSSGWESREGNSSLLSTAALRDSPAPAAASQPRQKKAEFRHRVPNGIRAAEHRGAARRGGRAALTDVSDVSSPSLRRPPCRAGFCTAAVRREAKRSLGSPLLEPQASAGSALSRSSPCGAALPPVTCPPIPTQPPLPQLAR